VFLLVPAYPGFPGTKAIKRWLLLLDWQPTQLKKAHRVDMPACAQLKNQASSAVLDVLQWRDYLLSQTG